VNFFASTETAQRWLEQHPDVRGAVVSVADAIGAGRAVFGDVVSRGVTPNSDAPSFGRARRGPTGAQNSARPHAPAVDGVIAAAWAPRFVTFGADSLMCPAGAALSPCSVPIRVASFVENRDERDGRYSRGRHSWP